MVRHEIISTAGGSGHPVEVSYVHLISHDLRALVRALRDLPEWIVEDIEAAELEVPQTARRSLELLQDRMTRLDTMLADLLTYATIGEDQVADTLQVGEVLDRVLMQFEIPPGFGVECKIRGASIHLGERDAKHFLRALVSNAVLHHGGVEGTVTVDCRTIGEMTRLSVADNGRGIDPGLHSKVFEPPFAAKPKDEREGSGMGLAIVARIAEHYGGTVRVVPTDVGTLIEAEFPRQA